MTEMLARAATAIRRCDSVFPLGDGRERLTDEEAETLARAAIAALREPTKAMLEDVEEPYNDGISQYTVRVVWVAYIDFLLQATKERL